MVFSRFSLKPCVNIKVGRTAVTGQIANVAIVDNYHSVYVKTLYQLPTYGNFSGLNFCGSVLN